jgi:hypothetical protein
MTGDIAEPAGRYDVVCGVLSAVLPRDQVFRRAATPLRGAKGAGVSARERIGLA